MDGQTDGQHREKVSFLWQLVEKDGDYVEDPLKHGKINFKLALKVGSNYEGAVPEENMKKIGVLVAPGVQLKWFLDKDQWCWTRQQPQEPQIVKLNVEGTSLTRPVTRL